MVEAVSYVVRTQYIEPSPGMWHDVLACVIVTSHRTVQAHVSINEVHNNESVAGRQTDCNNIHLD